MMVIPAVRGFKTLPVTALPRLIEKFSPVADGGSPEPDEDDKIHFSIPLAPVDRAVLDRLDQRWNLLDNLQKDDSYPSLLLHLFHNWDWSFTIQSRMLSLFTNQSVLEETQTRTQQYEAALHLAGWSKGFGRDEFRSLQLLKENEGFLARLGDRSFFSIKFVPSHEDRRYWDILVAMFLRVPEDMLFWMNAAERRRILHRNHDMLEWFASHYSIWKIARMFDLWSRRPSNRDQVFKLLSEGSHATHILRHAHDMQGLLLKYPSSNADSEVERDINESSGRLQETGTREEGDSVEQSENEDEDGSGDNGDRTINQNLDLFLASFTSENRLAVPHTDHYLELS
jgi:hypothetical protein